MRHSEHCKECKIAFRNNLLTNFGETLEQWKSGWPCNINDILESNDIEHNMKTILLKIHKALQNHRGHRKFTGVKKLPACDYLLVSRKQIIEFDESQHFTAPRHLTLSLYPSNIVLGYDINEWLDRAKSLNRHDNKPSHRDETRAWYDTLRDLLPSCYNMKPTIRIYSKNAIWCNNIDSDRFFNEFVKSNNKILKRKGFKPDFSKVNKNHVTLAIRKILRDGVPNNRKSKSTYIIHNKKLLPAKYVLWLSYQIATGYYLKPDDFSGGNYSGAILSKLGFEIHKK